MAASFVAASSTYLLSSGTPAVTAPPFTVAFWAKPTFSVGGNSTVYELAGTANDTNRYTFGNDGTPEWWIQAHNGVLDELDVTGPVANTWQFYCARVISATNRRLAILNADGTIISGQTVVNITTPASISREAIGGGASATVGNSPFDGLVGEFWVAGIDIQSDGLAINAEFLRYIAWNGPWAVPSIAANILRYKPFTQTIGTGTDVPNENITYGSPPAVWTNTNGVTLAPHCPLGPVYPKPTDSRRIGYG